MRGGGYPLFISILVLYAVVTFFFVFFLVRIIRTKRIKTKADQSFTGTLLLYDLKDFEEVAREDYPTPVATQTPVMEEIALESKEKENAVQELQEEAIAEEETPALEEASVEEEIIEEDEDEDLSDTEDFYDEYGQEVEEVKEVVEEHEYVTDIFGETVEDHLTYTDFDISKLASDFVTYAKIHGLEITPRSARSLFAALVGSHILFLKTASEALSIKTASLLENYFGNPKGSGSYYL
jgi:hypothetical protein